MLRLRVILVKAGINHRQYRKGGGARNMRLPDLRFTYGCDFVAPRLLGPLLGAGEALALRETFKCSPGTFAFTD